MRTVNLIDSNMQWASAEDAYLDSAGVQRFLEGFGSWLAKYKMPNGTAFSKWLWQKSIDHGIEPIMAMAMLQKEQSLIQKWRENDRPPQSKLDWACGYGASEGSRPENRDPDLKGFDVQIEKMLGSFQGYIDAGNEWPSIARWETVPVALYGDDGRKTGEKVLAGNLETALHLLYNPRIDGDGVSLLKNIWDRYYDHAQKLNLIRGDAVE